MAIDASLAGRTFPPAPPYEVGREKIREFARAIGDDDPAYADPAAARALGHPDVVAPPTFATVLSVRAVEQVLSDPAVGVYFARVVHGEERYRYVRTILAGDVLIATVTVEAVRSVGRHDLVALRTDVTTVDAEPVLTATTTMVVRGEAA